MSDELTTASLFGTQIQHMEPLDRVNGFDVPVPALDENFPLALVGTKGKWYDHQVMVSNPEKIS